MQKQIITNDKESLKLKLTGQEMGNYRREPIDIDQGNFDLTSINDDQLQRKTTLLQRKTKILEKTTVETWNSFMHIFWLSTIMSISGLQFGYGLCEITAIWNHDQLSDIYDLEIGSGISLALMVSFMPLGGIFGSIAAIKIIKLVSRKTAHLINNIICMISSFCFMQINEPQTILIGRFIYGWCIACYCSWSPLVIKQLSPVNLRPFMTSIFSIGRVVAIVLGYLLGLILYLLDVPSYYRIMFCIPGILAIIQIILIYVFVPNTPTELFAKRSFQEGRKVLQIIYKPQFVDIIYDTFSLEADIANLQKDEKKIEPYPQLKPNMKRAMYMGIHLGMFRQFLGLNTLASYAGLIISRSNPTIGPYTNFMMNGVQLIATIIASLWIVDRLGRRFLIIISVIFFAIFNYLIVVGLLIESSTVTIIMMILIMGTFGLSYSGVSWVYPDQILRPDQAAYASLTTWPVLFMATILPPIIAADTINGTPWPIFLFYGVYCTISFIYMFFCIIETKGRVYQQILQQF